MGAQTEPGAQDAAEGAIEMKTIGRFLTLLLLAGGWTLSAAALHVVRAPPAPGESQGLPERVIVVPKARLGFEDTYVDARSWTAADVGRHPEVTRRLIESGKAMALAHAVDARDADDVLRELSDLLNRVPVQAPARRGSGAQTTAPTGSVGFSIHF